MDIVLGIRVPDYIYEFYKKVSRQMQDGRNAEQIMADVLSLYAYRVTEELHLDEDAPQ